jgi:hypothetical protein
VNPLPSVIVLLVIFLCSCAPTSQMLQDEATKSHSAEGFSDSSLRGTWLMTATLKPYVKFGGPQVGSGKLRFDGHGNVSGQVVNFGVPADLMGTYHVDSDGSGTIDYTTAAPSNVVNNGQTRFRIVSADELDFQSKDSPNRDWASAAKVMESKDNGVVGTLRRVPPQ